MHVCLIWFCFLGFKTHLEKLKISSTGDVLEAGAPEVEGAIYVGTRQQEDAKRKAAVKNARTDVLQEIAERILDNGPGEFFLPAALDMPCI